MADFKEGCHSGRVACRTQAERISGGGKQILYPPHASTGSATEWRT